MPNIFDTYETLETLNCEIQYFKSLVILVISIKQIEAEDQKKLIETYNAKIAQIESTLSSIENEIQTSKNYSEFDLDGLEKLSQEFAIRFDLDESTVSDQDSKEVLDLKFKYNQLNNEIDHYKSQISNLKKSIIIYNNNLKIYDDQYQYLESMYRILKLEFNKNFNKYENSLINEEQSRKLVDIQTQCQFAKQMFYQYYRDLKIEKIGKDYYTRRNLISNIIVRAENFLDKFNHYLLIEKKLKLKDLTPIQDFYHENFRDGSKCNLSMSAIVKILKSILTMPQELEQFYTTSPILLKDNVTRVNPNPTEDYMSTDSKLKDIDTKLSNYVKALNKSVDKLNKVYALIFNQYNVDAFSDYVDNTFVEFNTHKRFENSYKDRYISNLFAPKPQNTLNNHPQKTLNKQPNKTLNKHPNQGESSALNQKSRMTLSNH